MDHVVDLASYSRFRPDLMKLASSRLVSARETLGWSHADLAIALTEMVAWTVSPEVLESWETEAAPSEILMATDLLQAFSWLWDRSSPVC